MSDSEDPDFGEEEEFAQEAYRNAGGAGEIRRPRRVMPNDAKKIDRDRATAAETDPPPLEQVRALLRAQAEAIQAEAAAVQRKVDEFNALDQAGRQAAIQQLADQAKEALKSSISDEMNRLNYGSGFKDLEKLSESLRNNPNFVNNADATRSRGTEMDRRRQFMRAVAGVREDNEDVFTTMFADGTVCAYDAMLAAAGVNDFRNNQRVTAGLRVAQQRFFSGREVCLYMDTGLLCCTHSDMRRQDLRGSTNTYATFDYLNTPYVGKAAARDKFVYGSSKTKLLDAKPRLTFSAYKDALPAKREEMIRAEITSDQPTGRDGDIAGRVVRATHFAILEALLIQDPNLNWAVVKAEYEERGLTLRDEDGRSRHTASLLEDFDGRMATEYTTLLYRIVHGDDGRDTALRALTAAQRKDAMPPLPEFGEDVADRTYANLKGVSWPARGKTFSDAPAVDTREKAARGYIRRVVYTALRAHWFPRSVAFVHLLNTLEFAALARGDNGGNNWAFQRTFLSRTAVANALADERAEDVFVAQIINAMRNIGNQIDSGKSALATDRVAEDAVLLMKQNNKRRTIRAGDLQLQLRDDGRPARPVYKMRTQQRMEDLYRLVYDGVAMDTLYENWPAIGFYMGLTTLVVATGYYGINHLISITTPPTAGDLGAGAVDFALDVMGGAAGVVAGGANQLAERAGLNAAARVVVVNAGAAAAATSVRATGAFEFARQSLTDATDFISLREAGLGENLSEYLAITPAETVAATVAAAHAEIDPSSGGADAPTAATASHESQSETLIAGYERQRAYEASDEDAGPPVPPQVADLSPNDVRGMMSGSAAHILERINMRAPSAGRKATDRVLRSASAAARKGKGKRTQDTRSAPVVMPNWFMPQQNETDFFATGALAARRMAELS
tara:strand:- start:940 stop:3651 length:2712 start_codon:yes stop_codon:yes gene_type:complete